MIDKLDELHYELFRMCRKMEPGTDEKELIQEALDLMADALDIMLDKAAKAVGE